MTRETFLVTLILLISGIAILAIALLFLVALIMFMLEPNEDGPILWDEVALYFIPTVVLGCFLISLGIINFRRRIGLK